MNLGLQEIGKGFINLSNFLSVLFLLNNYLQKDDLNPFLVVITVIGIICLYILGYKSINKGAKK